LQLGALAGALAVGLAWSVAGARPLAVIRNLGVLSLCAHANSLPFASKTQDPPGFQIELGRALASELGVRLQVAWVVSGIQFRTADCDIVLDTIAVPEAQAERRLELSKAYQRSGVGLAVRPDTPGVGKFEDLIGRRVAVQSGSLAGMLLGQRGVRLSAFGFNLRHPEAHLRFVHAYEAEPELRWDLAVGLRRADASLREAIDGAIDRLVADGTVGKIYARYGIEHRPPLGR
jgi:polar amino acid transport system substrate-binding protein